MKRKTEVKKVIKQYDRLTITLLLFVIFFMVAVVGAMSNMHAVSSNGGKMPVKAEYALDHSPTHFYFTDYSTIKLPLLVDRFQIKNYIYSIGDFLIYFGAFTTIVTGIFMLIFSFKLNKIKRRYNG